MKNISFYAIYCFQNFTKVNYRSSSTFGQKISAPNLKLLFSTWNFAIQARLRRAYFEKSARPNLKFWIGKICYIWFEHGQMSEMWLSKIPLDQNFHCDVCLNYFFDFLVFHHSRNFKLFFKQARLRRAYGAPVWL